jgi:bifunctional non-homologous end joining protein LigD
MAARSHGTLDLPRERHPEWIPPMLATLTEKRFSDRSWIFERKLDGIRLLAFRDGERLRLLTRNKLDRRASFPHVAEALLEQPWRDFVVDGEVVAMKGGATSFSMLQQGTGSIYYYVFDIVHFDGRNTRGLPLLERKRMLQEAIDFSPRALRMTTHRATFGERYLDEACAKGWEGLIAKEISSLYETKRSRAWLKLKCVNEQELVIGGFTDPRGSRTGFGALLAGYYEGGVLRYAGAVGTGFDAELLRSLHAKLVKLEQPSPPFAVDEELPKKGVHWVRPTLVAQVGFAEWTPTGKLRHPRFLGLRTDKSASDVVRERPS